MGNLTKATCRKIRYYMTWRWQHNSETSKIDLIDPNNHCTTVHAHILLFIKSAFYYFIIGGGILFPYLVNLLYDSAGHNIYTKYTFPTMPRTTSLLPPFTTSLLPFIFTCRIRFVLSQS